jgi:AcrR family transcriptional regulator
MAKGRSSARRAGNGASTAPAAGDRDRIIDATLRRIAEQGWRRLSMGAVAAEAGLPILIVYRNFGSRLAILSAFLRRIDEAVLAVPAETEAAGEFGEQPRDRVFDLLMRRFDALLPYRDAMTVLGRELPTDPCVALAIGARLLRSIAWTLEAAGIPVTGLGGAVATKLTAAAYLATMRVWLRDDSPDLAPTMAALDRRLRGIERWFARTRRPPRPAAAEA